MKRAANIGGGIALPSLIPETIVPGRGDEWMTLDQAVVKTNSVKTFAKTVTGGARIEAAEELR